MPDLPKGPSLVLKDVFGHPGAAITEIAERTVLPQSYVSESVARLREQGVVATRFDPADRRRTLATLTEVLDAWSCSSPSDSQRA